MGLPAELSRPVERSRAPTSSSASVSVLACWQEEPCTISGEALQAAQRQARGSGCRRACALAAAGSTCSNGSHFAVDFLANTPVPQFRKNRQGPRCSFEFSSRERALEFPAAGARSQWRHWSLWRAGPIAFRVPGVRGVPTTHSPCTLPSTCSLQHAGGPRWIAAGLKVLKRSRTRASPIAEPRRRDALETN
jgi:hypothetical protein